MINLKNISVAYDNTQVLKSINLFIDKEEFIALIGNNGTGKTTLLKVLTGIIQPTEGQVLHMNDLNIGYVPQHTNFDKEFPINVEQVVLSGTLSNRIRPFHSYSLVDKRRSKEVLKEFGLWELKKRLLSNISGGQLQKVLIARALVSNPDIIMLDEPTSNIDDSTTEEIFKTLKQISNKITVVLVSHDTTRVSKYAKKIYDVNNKGINRIK